jgi:hypothetical protein
MPMSPEGSLRLMSLLSDAWCAAAAEFGLFRFHFQFRDNPPEPLNQEKGGD